MKKIYYLLSLAVMALLFAGCSLDEPKDDGGEGGSSTGSSRLESIRAYSQTAVQVTYDSQGRPTRVLFPFGEMDWKISYDPMKIVCTEYEEKEIIEQDVYTDIVMSNNRITSLILTENLNDEIYVSRNTFTYDNEGHLIEVFTDGIGDNDSDYTYYTWENGLLTRISHSDEYEGDCTIEYGNMPNKNGQWSMFWPGFNPLSIFGWFGTAPVKFPSSAIDDGETYRYEYKLTSNGYIKSERYMEEGESLVFTYNYSKKSK